MLNYQLELLNKDSKTLWVKTKKLLQQPLSHLTQKLPKTDEHKANTFAEYISKTFKPSPDVNRKH